MTNNPQAPGSKPRKTDSGEEKGRGETLGESGSRQMRGDAQSKPGKASKIQGEGDYEAARRYREDVEGFVAEEGPEGIARKAEEAENAVDGPEASELRIAEKKGEERAKR